MRHIRRALALGLALALTLTGGFALSGPTVYGYREGLAKAEENGRWGFVNTAGQVVVPIQYQSVLDFSLGTALVQRGGKLGVIRQDGKELLPTEYDTLEDIGYGLYRAQQGDYWGVVSLMPFPGNKGEPTQNFYAIVNDSVTMTQSEGVEMLVCVQEGQTFTTPLSSLPRLMAERQVPSAQFPLVKGRIPAFSDVGTRDWFTVWVDLAYNVGLMEGVGEGRFAPGQTLTVAETLKLAAQMESRANWDDFHTQPVVGTPWYRSAVTYCIACGIISEGEFDDYERPITRAEMARIFAATTQGRRMPRINDMARVRQRVPDVQPRDYAAESIYTLYAQGILTGTDGALTFNPDGLLTRAEAAAIVARMARAEQRVTLWEE